MATNPRFVTTKALEELFINKTSGQRLAGGKIYFFKDEDRLVPKNVYQITGMPPNYSFSVLANPLELSGVGTIVNGAGGTGDNIPLYYLPYVSETSDTIELYYVVVTDADDNVQFTREGWPDLSDTQSPSNVTDGTIINEISNSQFVDVNFISSETLSIPYTGNSTTTMAIAPDWDIVIAHSDAGTVTVTRTAIAGSSHTPTNPPYTLSVTSGANVTSLKLRQRFSGNPDIWVPSAAGVAGYINGGILLGANTSVVMRYEPSVGTAQEILNTTNTSGAIAYSSNTVQLTIGDNTAVGGAGYVDITLALSVANGFVSTISSVQIVGLVANEDTISYKQDSINRQEDYLAHYYKPLLAAMPVASYLECWDFPLNPHQLLTATVAASSTAPGFSKYVWDQTILFQSQDSGIGVTQSSTGAIVLTNALGTATRAALIQYQEGLKARDILNSKISSMVRAFASANVTATISLWYTTGTALPVLTAGTANSIVQTLDANGKPATFNQANGVDWTEVPRLPVDGGTASTQNATFTIGTSADLNFNEYGFSGWDLDGIAAVGTATFFAIVVGTGDIASGGTVTIDSISLVPGDIPTRPAHQTDEAVISDARRYYEKSFRLSTVAAANGGGAVSANLGFYQFSQDVAASTGDIAATIMMRSHKRANPNVTIYNPFAAGNEIWNANIGAAWTGTSVDNITEDSFKVLGTTPGGSTVGESSNFHWEADARLGLF